MIEFEHTLEMNGHELHVTVEADGKVYTDLYGADADGNRGEWRTECDDVEFTIKDARGNDITEKVRTKWVAEFDAIDELAADKLIDAYNERQTE
jgi:hypothetical protein